MIILEFFLFFLSIIIVSVSIAGFGSFFSTKPKSNFFLEIFLGFIIISLIITIIHFFFKINLLIAFLIFSFGLLIFFIKKKLSFLKIFKIERIYYLIIILLLIPIFISQKYHEDFGYYHLPYALSFIEEKIIFGFANIDKPYVYNSIWLNLYSIFFLSDKNFDFLTLPSFLLFLSFILFSFNKLFLNNEKKSSDYFLLITLFYFILKFTRISEFGVDLPAVIFSILTIYFFLRFSETNLKDERGEYFFLITIFSIFSILIKLSTIPIIFLTIYLYLKYFRDLKFCIFKLKFFFIYFLSITFFIQQFIYTGCILFPNDFTCLNVSWFNRDNIDLSRELELTNKSYSIAKDYFTPEEYLKNLNWFSFWLKRSIIEISEHLLTIILPIILFLYFHKNKIDQNYVLKDKSGLYIFFIFGLLFWLNYSPVYRFAIHLFITLIFILIINILMKKNFSKKIFLVFVMFFIFFSFSKNIIRLNKVENVFFGIQKMNNEYILNKKNINQPVKIYMPDVKKNTLLNGYQGISCWNIPFICSYNKLDIQEKNGYLIINKLSN
ncbi:LIC_10190 family membrane protein [Candidatus Pelagibacter sp.]|uniref:LIC_10190 family membrane protein n=1 Tax=Candidatus Pelagibacter sp. TaxID=2024849 RepID=UPI003F839E5A